MVTETQKKFIETDMGVFEVEAICWNGKDYMYEEKITVEAASSREAIEEAMKLIDTEDGDITKIRVTDVNLLTVVQNRKL